MGKPKVFISSTYIDLKELRDKIRNFISEYGFDPILFERGNIPFTPDKELDQACYDEVKDSHIFVMIIGGRYGSPSSQTSRKSRKHYNSIVKEEFLTAVAQGIPIHPFIYSSVWAEFQTYQNNKKNKGIKYSHVDDANIFELIDCIYKSRAKPFIKPFEVGSEIIDWLKEQWAGMLKNYIEGLKKSYSISDDIRLNVYKFYYFRNQSTNKKSLKTVSQDTGITIEKLRKFETVSNLAQINKQNFFPKISLDDLQSIAHSISINPNELVAGKSDDFSPRFIQYYKIYKILKANQRQSNLRNENENPIIFPAKIVVLDFDGTLTHPNKNHTTWEDIWLKLDYPISEPDKYHNKFSNHEITHLEWCDITLNKFRDRNFSKIQIIEIAKKTKLINGVKETLRELHKKGIKLYLLSGSIKEIIRYVLGDCYEMFIEIKANQILFDDKGIICDIIGTKYDFEGKEHFLREIVETNKVSVHEVLYIGNSLNDLWAHQSGVSTLCINPVNIDPYDGVHWNYYLRDIQNFKEVIKYILPE